MRPHNPPSTEGTTELLSVQVVATLLGCSTRHIYRLADSGQMPKPLRLGHLVRWHRGQIMAWINEGCPVLTANLRGGK